MNFNGKRKPRSVNRLILCSGVLILCIAGLLNCRPAIAFEKRELTIERAGGTPLVIQVEIARSAEEKSRGLMYRKSLEDGKGMLFVNDRDSNPAFWMKDTQIPLSIAFISSTGRIVEIYDLEPFSEKTVSPNRAVRYALEAPRGWFERAGVRTGDLLLVDEIL
jgi:uncharacterized membrane protein (UPF0127 family)